MEDVREPIRFIAKEHEHQFRWLTHEEKHAVLGIPDGQKCNRPAMVQCVKCKRYSYST